MGHHLRLLHLWAIGGRLLQQRGPLASSLSAGRRGLARAHALPRHGSASPTTSLILKGSASPTATLATAAQLALSVNPKP